MSEEKRESIEAEAPAKYDEVPSLTEEQRAEVAKKLLDLARGLDDINYAATKMQVAENPYSKVVHSDNDGWV